MPAIALDAKFRSSGRRASGEVAAGDYFQMPDRNLFGETVLAPNELLTHVILPAPGASRNATYEVRFKQSHDWPLAFASVALSMNGQTVRARADRDGRGRAGAVAVGGGRSGARRQAAVGRGGDGSRGRRRQGAKPMTRNAYKVQIARTAVKRAIMKAAGLTVPVIERYVSR